MFDPIAISAAVEEVGIKRISTWAVRAILRHSFRIHSDYRLIHAWLSQEYGHHFHLYITSPTFPSHSSPDRVAVNYISDQIIQWVNRIETDFGATSRELVLATHWSRSLIQNVVIYVLEGTLPENMLATMG